MTSPRVASVFSETRRNLQTVFRKYTLPLAGKRLLEVSNTAQHARPVGRTRTAYPFIAWTKASDMRLGLMRRRKKYNMKELDARRMYRDR